MTKDLRGYYYASIIKSLKYLEYSYGRVQALSTNPSELSDAEMETWDGFATRFARSSDIFLSKFLKAAVKHDDPVFDGSFRDILNRAEKLRYIENIDQWVVIRDLRNVVVHEYSDSDLQKILEKMRTLAPLILALRVKLANLI